MIGSLIIEYPGYSLISDRDSARDCFFNDLGFFFKGLFLTDSLVGYMLTLLFTSVSVKAQDIHLHFGELLLAIYFLAFMRNGTRGCFQIQGIFHYFRAFKTEILHIYSLTGQILKQLSPSVSVTSNRYLPRRSADR